MVKSKKLLPTSREKTITLDYTKKLYQDWQYAVLDISMGNGLMVEHWNLTPVVAVRFYLPQPEF